MDRRHAEYLLLEIHHRCPEWRCTMLLLLPRPRPRAAKQRRHRSGFLLSRLTRRLVSLHPSHSERSSKKPAPIGRHQRESYRCPPPTTSSAGVLFYTSVAA